jgi:hypothetical protein
MKLIFMYDNHTFARPFRGEASPAREWIAARFAEDICGSVFGYTARGYSIDHLHAVYENKRYTLREEDIDAFLAKVEEYENWEARG